MNLLIFYKLLKKLRLMSIKINRLEEGHNSYPLVCRRPAETVSLQRRQISSSVFKLIHVIFSSMKFISNEICKICFFQMQREHRLALTKNYVLLVSGTPVDDILDDLRQQQIVNEEQREFIARHSTHKGRTRALLELLPRRGPKAFHAFCYVLLTRNKNNLVSVLTDPEKDYSSFHLSGEVCLRAEREEITLKQGD